MRFTGNVKCGEISGELANESHATLQRIAVQIVHKHRVKFRANDQFLFFQKNVL